MLEIINKDDEVVGHETRAKVHEEGLLHREIHIWFITPQAEIVFQHRAKDKDTYPDKLDATVGGHVEPEMSYEETAVKECREETGVDVDLRELIFLTKMHTRTIDIDTGLINNAIRRQYAYLYEGAIGELVIEEGKAFGFEAWEIDVLPQLSEQNKKKFIPAFLSDECFSLFNEARKKVSV